MRNLSFLQVIVKEIYCCKKTFAWNSEAPNKVWIGSRDGYNESLMRDPSLAYPEARAIMSFPGGHNEGFPDTSKQLFKEVYEAVAANNRRMPPILLSPMAIVNC